MAARLGAVILLASLIAGFVGIASAGKRETGFLDRTAQVGGKT
jgi:hypothetical protein